MTLSFYPLEDRPERQQMDANVHHAERTLTPCIQGQYPELTSSRRRFDIEEVTRKCKPKRKNDR